MTGKLDAAGFGRIRRLAVALPALAIGLFESLRHGWLAHALPGWLAEGWPGNALGALVVGGVVYGFVRVFAGLVRRSALETVRAREEAAAVFERQRIAREMHDNVAQTLFYLGANLREVGALVEAGERDEALAELRAAEGYLKEAHGRVRAVIADSSDRRDDGPEDLRESVQSVASRLAMRLGMRVECRVTGRPRPPLHSREHVLAIIHEALTNARRHGRAGEAVVRVGAADEEPGGGFSIEVSDDGSGFDPAGMTGEGSYGLAIMAERARLIGGQFALASAPGRGTRVTVRVPGAPEVPGEDA